MNGASDWVSTALGIALVLLALADVVHTMWHPSGQGRLSKLLLRLVWRLCQPLGEPGRRACGPVGMMVVVISWAGLVLVGWALIYWPHLPGGFSFDPGTTPADPAFLDALYISAVVLSTLGFGDVVPAGVPIRMVAPLESLIGFALLTAAVSWVLQVYPALTRRRTLSLQLDALRTAKTHEQLGQLSPVTAASLLRAISDGLSGIRVDYTQYVETYYFRDSDRATSLGATLPYAHELALAAKECDSGDLQHSGTVLENSVDELARLIDRQYFRAGGDTATILTRFRRDQADV